MNRSSVALSLVSTLFFSLALADSASAHGGGYRGGKYRGPGDVVGPNTGAPHRPKTGGPTTPGPSAPSAPGPVTPGPTTPGPSAPSAPPPVTGGPSAPRATGGGPKTGPRGIQLGEDFSNWQTWWVYNKDRFIDLKEAIHSPVTITGSDEFYMGHSRRMDSQDTSKPSDTEIQEIILPALKRTLDSTQNRDITSSCLIALAKIGRDHPDFEVLHIFRKALVTHDQEIRETAALSMGISQQAKAVEDLTALAEDSDEGRKLLQRSHVDFRTRAFAIYGLGLVAYANKDLDLKRSVFGTLESLLGNQDLDGRNLRVSTVTAIGLLNLDRKSKDAKTRSLRDAALKALDGYYSSSLGPDQEFMQSHVPGAVAKLLGRGSDDLRNAYKQKYAAQLSSKKKKRNNNIYRGAALALGQLVEPSPADAKYSAALLDYYKKGKDVQTRYFCLIALGQIGGTENRNALLKVLAKGSKSLERPWAALALGVQSFNRMAKDPAARVDVTVGDCIVKEFMQVRDPAARSAFAVALGLCKHTDVGGDLLDVLRRYRHQNDFAGYLCIGMALMDYRKALPEIHDLVRTSVRRPELLQQAAIALGKMGDKMVTTTLHQMLQEKEPNLAKLSAISSALGYIGDRRSIQPLRKILFDESLTMLSRAFAAVALGSVADKEKLPWNAKIAGDINYRASVETLTESGTGVLNIL